MANTKGNSYFSCNCFIYLMTTRTHNPLHLSHTLLVLTVKAALSSSNSMNPDLIISLAHSAKLLYIQYTSSETHATFLLPMCPIRGKYLCWCVAQADPFPNLQTYDALRPIMLVIPTAVLLYTSMCTDPSAAMLPQLLLLCNMLQLPNILT